MILAADGRLRGEVEIPRNHRVAWHTGDIVWMVESDDVGVPWLVKRRIAAAP